MGSKSKSSTDTRSTSRTDTHIDTKNTAIGAHASGMPIIADRSSVVFNDGNALAIASQAIGHQANSVNATQNTFASFAASLERVVSRALNNIGAQNQITNNLAAGVANNSVQFAGDALDSAEALIRDAVESSEALVGDVVDDAFDLVAGGFSESLSAIERANRDSLAEIVTLANNDRADIVDIAQSAKNPEQDLVKAAFIAVGLIGLGALYFNRRAA